jgi:hypothetical protein
MPHFSWSEGVVDTSNEHIEIRFGNSSDSGWDTWVPIALVSPPHQFKFTVQFLISRKDSKAKDMIEAVHRELDFYLVEKEEPDPWIYAQHHCRTGANVYSNVHWGYRPRRSNAK